MVLSQRSQNVFLYLKVSKFITLLSLHQVLLCSEYYDSFVLQTALPILSAICGGHGVSSWIDRWSDGRLIEILVLIIIFWKRGEWKPGLWGWPRIVRCFGALFPMVLSRCDKNKWPGPLISFSSSWKNKMLMQAMIWQWCTAHSTAAPLTRAS